MKPVSRRCLPSSNQIVYTGLKNKISNISGVVTAPSGYSVKNSTVVLFKIAKYEPIAICRVDSTGQYTFKNIDPIYNTYIIAFDNSGIFNPSIHFGITSD